MAKYDERLKVVQSRVSDFSALELLVEDILINS
jgi:hypothetical protein